MIMELYLYNDWVQRKKKQTIHANCINFENTKANDWKHWSLNNKPIAEKLEEF